MSCDSIKTSNKMNDEKELKALYNNINKILSLRMNGGSIRDSDKPEPGAYAQFIVVQR